MGDEKMVSAEEARGLLDGIQPTDLPWKTYRDGRDYVVDAQDCAVCEGDMLRSEARLLAAAPDLARTVIALHKRLEGVGVVEGHTTDPGQYDSEAFHVAVRLRRERDEARSAPRPCPWCDGRIGVDGVSFHAPGCKVIEADALKAERDRLARILACERGDESQAPEGWSRMEHVSGWRRRDRHGRGWTVRYERLGDDWHTVCVYLDGIRVGGEHPTAMEAMEAADAAREGSDV